MKEIPIRPCESIHLYGRRNANEETFSPNWSGSGLEVVAHAGTLEIEIECSYTTHKPYISFEVDGLRAQTFSPLNGKHWYNIYLNLNAEADHKVRVIRETQPFTGDPLAFIRFTRLRLDGELLPVPAKRRRIEFIGDSITSGEGGRGPVSFVEWVPMVFCASDNYSRMTADLMNADYQVVSQSGNGLFMSWDNDPAGNMPDLYDEVCGVTNEGKTPYDFSFQPDTVVVALGTNDRSAINWAAHTDPATGKTYKLTNSAEDMKRVEDTAHRFLTHLHEKNPGARIIWMLFYHDENIEPAISRGIARAVKDGIDACHIFPIDLGHPNKLTIGCRYHPGIFAHKHIAKALVAEMKRGDKKRK